MLLLDAQVQERELPWMLVMLGGYRPAHGRAQSRGINVICRYGGDEFAVLLVETSKSGARLYADRIRYVLSTWAFAHGRRVTASFGIASLPEDVAPAADEMIRAADEALYAAKRSGKNRVSVHEDIGRTAPSGHPGA